MVDGEELELLAATTTTVGCDVVNVCQMRHQHPVISWNRPVYIPQYTVLAAKRRATTPSETPTQTVGDSSRRQKYDTGSALFPMTKNMLLYGRGET